MTPERFEIISAFVAFVGFGGMAVMLGWVWQLASRLTLLEAETRAAKLLAERAEKAAAEAARRQQDFEVDAARRFVTDEMLTKFEERLTDAISRLGDRLDRAFERQPPRQPR